MTSHERRFFPEPVAAKVPEIILLFWVVKILTTAGGEATSDYFVHRFNPEAAVLVEAPGLGAADLNRLAASGGRSAARPLKRWKIANMPAAAINAPNPIWKA